ncbi:MAG: DinB family protein [Actinomycetota bacterium]|nr:DinB family protein [Actinomycetota bacterium]
MTELAPDPELLPAGDEAALLHSFLDYYRTILLRKAEGLTDAQARLVLPPSDLTVLGLVRHMAEVERGWFRRRFMAHDAPFLFCTDDDPDRDFHVTDADSLADALVALRAEIDFARESTRSAAMDTLAAAVPPTQRIAGWQPNLRWILIHMIEEYARHCGHADLLREAADGATGD